MDLQSNLLSLKGFSFINLKKMQQFHEAYSNFESRLSTTTQMIDTDSMAHNGGNNPTQKKMNLAAKPLY